MTRRPNVYRISAQKVSAVEFYVAAEDEKEARRIANTVACNEIDWSDMWDDTEIDSVHLAHDENGPESIPQKWLDEMGGIWAEGPARPGGRETGGWVKYADQLDDLPPKPDPNQIAFDLSAL